MSFLEISWLGFFFGLSIAAGVSFAVLVGMATEGLWSWLKKEDRRGKFRGEQ